MGQGCINVIVAEIIIPQPTSSMAHLAFADQELVLPAIRPEFGETLFLQGSEVREALGVQRNSASEWYALDAISDEMVNWLVTPASRPLPGVPLNLYGLHPDDTWKIYARSQRWEKSQVAMCSQEKEVVDVKLEDPVLDEGIGSMSP